VARLPLRYHLLNVFTRDAAKLSGNPLCVFEDGRGLDDATLQALARQFNLSETTFLLPSQRATARVRIFTPDFEMPFAGHPTLGTAHIVRLLAGAPAGATGSGRLLDALTLEMSAGIIPVTASDDTWTLVAGAPKFREVQTAPEALAAALGLAPADLLSSTGGPRPLWVDTGSEQLIVPLANAAALRVLAPSAAALDALRSRQGRRMVHAFVEQDDGTVTARFLFEADGAMREDPATGSACANLGGWYLATAATLPLRRRVEQGDAVRRPSTLGLAVGADGRIEVSGQVVHLGRGEVTL
jgi:PhzF family phenazine biosynthesis protein